MVFEPWISSATLTGGGAALASGVGAVVGVDAGVIAAGGDGLVRKGAGVVAATTDATELGFGFNRYQAPDADSADQESENQEHGHKNIYGPFTSGSERSAALRAYQLRAVRDLNSMFEAIGIIRLSAIAEVGANTLFHSGNPPTHSHRRCCEFHRGFASGEDCFVARICGVPIALVCLKGLHFTKDALPQCLTAFLASNVLVHPVQRGSLDQVEVGFINSVGCLQESSTQQHCRVVEAVCILGQQSKLRFAGTVSTLLDDPHALGQD